MASRQISIGRINRRYEDVLTAATPSSFADELKAMVASGEIRTVQTVPGRRGPERLEWVATDMTLDPSETFVTGVIGYAVGDKAYDLDEESNSWLKGERDLPPAGSDRSLVPFAVDLREERRWVAFGTSQRIRRQTFCQHFQAALNKAVDALGLMAANWEVDLVSSVAQVTEWLQTHPQVRQFVRILKFPNPNRNLDDDRRQMQALAANKAEEKFTTSGRDSGLRLLGNPEFEALLEGLDEGYIQIKLSQGVHGEKYDSAESAETVLVDDWHGDLARGTAAVLDALRAYSARRAGEGQQDLEV